MESRKEVARSEDDVDEEKQDLHKYCFVARVTPSSLRKDVLVKEFASVSDVPLLKTITLKNLFASKSYTL